MLLKLILAAICIFSALADYSHTKWITAKFGKCAECNKAARVGPFTSIVGVTILWTMLLGALPSPIPLAFLAGMKVNLFYLQRVSRQLLAE